MIKLHIENDRIHQQVFGKKFEVYGECVMAVLSIANFLEEKMPFFNADIFYKTVEDERKRNATHKDIDINLPTDLKNLFKELFCKEE